MDRKSLCGSSPTEEYLCFMNNFSNTEADKKIILVTFFLLEMLTCLYWQQLGWLKGVLECQHGFSHSEAGEGEERLKTRRMYVLMWVFSQRVKPECKHLLTIQMANIYHSGLRNVHVSLCKFPPMLIYRWVTGNPCLAKVEKQHYYISFYLRLLSWMKIKTFVIRKITWMKSGGKNLCQELECSHWKNQDLVSSGIEEMRGFMKSAQCLTSPHHELYNVVTLFIVSLFYPKWQRFTNTRCSYGCVANKTCVMLTRKAEKKAI